jgi:hypothetical protein
MRNREPVPDRRYGGDHPEREPLDQLPGSEQDLWSEPRLTIAEAARLCGVSASIRRYLAAGRFPGAHRQPSPIPGQRGLWRISTQDLLAAGLRSRQTRTPDQQQQHQPARRRATAQPAADRFENSSMPWRLSGSAAEPPRTWPPSGPTRSDPERRPGGAASTARRPSPQPRPRRFLTSATIQRHLHRRASPPARHLTHGAEATADQARTQPGGEGGDYRTGAQRAAATKAALALTAPSI